MKENENIQLSDIININSNLLYFLNCAVYKHDEYLSL